MMRARDFPMLPVLLLTASLSTSRAADPRPVHCEGRYDKHLQGTCAAGDGSLYWCFTTQLVKTDAAGKLLKRIEVGNHHGDLCCVNDRVYVAVNFGAFNKPAGSADSWVYEYDANDLSLSAKHATRELAHGAGGIAHHAGRFIVVGGLPLGVEENYAYEYDQAFNFVRRHVLRTGYTLMGIQTAAFADGHWWFGCYGMPQSLLKADEQFQHVERFTFDASLGIVPLGAGRFQVGRGGRADKAHAGSLVYAVADREDGLRLLDEPSLP